MVTTGNTLMAETKTLSGTLTNGIEKPLTTIAQTLSGSRNLLQNIDAAQTALQNACKNINDVVASDNQTIKTSKDNSKEQFRFYCCIYKSTGSKVCRNLG